MTKDEAREVVYGMPYADWVAQNQTPADAAKQAEFAEAFRANVGGSRRSRGRGVQIWTLGKLTELQGSVNSSSPDVRRTVQGQVCPGRILIVGTGRAGFAGRGAAKE